MTTSVLDAAVGPNEPFGQAEDIVAEQITSRAIPLIELQGVMRTFTTGGGVEVHALRGIDLKIYPGEFLAIVGQSGSGKSTLMNILGCLDRPTAGKYIFAGRDIESFDADGLAWLRREAFGFVFQSYNLLGTESALENVQVPAVYAGLNAHERLIRAESLLSALGLGDRMDHRPTQLSGGQQQRVSIARAMMNGGNVILADEPTGALDTQSGIEVMELLEDLAAKGHTVILITHDQEVANHAERIIEFRDGEIVSDTNSRPENVDPKNNAKLRELFLSRKATSSLAGTGEAIRMALRSLKANIFRTMLTLLGIVIGVSSVVAMLAIGEGAQQDIIQIMNQLGTNVITVRPERLPGSFRSMPSTLTVDDAAALGSNVPNIVAAIPQMQSRNMSVRFGRNDTQTSLVATTGDMPEVESWPLAQGVFFTDMDSENITSVAVLGFEARSDLFPEGQDPLGEYILIGNIPFQVIGVLTAKGAQGFNNPDDTIYIPFRTGAVRVFGKAEADEIRVLVDDIEQIDQTEQNMLEYLTALHGTQDMRIDQNTSMLESASESQKTFTLLLGSVAAISLLVGGIGVMNIMLVSVTERTREIGVRMATGARQSDILSQFLAEAIVVSCFGGIIGVTLGVTVGLILQRFDVSIYFSSTPMLLAFTCSVTTGLIFGFAPARKASQLDPVVALANE
jgi:macrolide transport system ATP-binding/permease protein